MTPERWQQVAKIYEQVVDQDPTTREAYLAIACAGDATLRGEVESLLDDDRVSILDRPVWAAVAPLLGEGPVGAGDSLGPYRIDARLGAGGMGEVFRATDTRLNRAVAIKILPPGGALDQRMRARFAREAMAVAALAHPHICTLHDVGSHEQTEFLVMECLEGETLSARLVRGPLPIAEALTYASQIASALDHAHRHGIVHRDLKPANIMLTSGGAKLLDFGLAKFRETEEVATAGMRSATDGVGEGDDGHLTRHGTILGTVRYMAPEQLKGEEVDARSDLFSLGAVIFEMLTGRPAFAGKTVSEVRGAVLEREPPAVSSLEVAVPGAIDAIVRRCLAKNKNERTSSASDVMRALMSLMESRAGRGRTWRWAAGIIAAIATGFSLWVLAAGIWPRWRQVSPGEIRSLAVLPLDSAGGEAEQEYIADAVTDQLIADLAAIKDLRVISGSSVLPYRGTKDEVPTIARELNVDAIVAGSVVQANDRVRISAQLIRGATGDIIWAQAFDRDVRDVLTLQRDVALAIRNRVGAPVTANDQREFASVRKIDPQVHRQFLLGRHHLAKSTEESLHRAVGHFEAAVATDPANAPAYAGLATVYTELAGFYLPPAAVMPKAKSAAEAALRLDESLADAHAALGYVHLVYDWDGPAAEKSLLRALDLNPALAVARLNYAAYLSTQGRFDETIREVKRALDLDPKSIRTHALGTTLLLFCRRYDEAIELARKGLEFEPGSAFILAFQGVALAELHRFEEAVANVRKAASLDNSLTIRALQAHVLAVAGLKEEAASVLREVQEAAKHRYFCPYEIATVHASLGNMDTAYQLFRKGTDEHADCMAWLGVEPWLDTFRLDPRYHALLSEIGLAPDAH